MLHLYLTGNHFCAQFSFSVIAISSPFWYVLQFAVLVLPVTDFSPTPRMRVAQLHPVE